MRGKAAARMVGGDNRGGRLGKLLLEASAVAGHNEFLPP
jgi:hypothetical protein